MKNFKNFFFLTTLIAIVMTSFSFESQAQSENFSLNFEEIKSWNVARVPTKIPDGRVIMATNKENGAQLIALMKRGKIGQVGVVPVRGKFIALKPSAAPSCLGPGLCATFQAVHCYTMPWGECVCVCGGFISAGN